MSKAVFILLVFATGVSHAGKFDFRSPGAFVDDCSGKIYRVWSRATHLGAKLVLGSAEAEKRAIERLFRLRRRKLNTDDRAMSFLAEHPVYLSVTTIPSRIKFLPKVLKSIDSEYLSGIIVNIPTLSARGGDGFQIPTDLLTIEKVTIVRTENDVGPGQKLIGAIDHLAGTPKAPYVITIDDDMIYPRGMVNELIYAAALFPGVVIGGVGAPLSYWHIDGIPSYAAADRFWMDDLSFRAVDVVEGYAGVIYPTKSIDRDLVVDWLSQNNECRFSDDLVFSLALRKSAVKRFDMRSPYFNRSWIYHMGYGYLEDALHLGGGLDDYQGDGGLTAPNQNKYQKAFLTLKSHVDGS